MKFKHLVSTVLLLAVLSTASPIQSRIVPAAPDIVNMLRKADLVVVGLASKIGEQDITSYYTLEISRVIKGKASSGVVNLEWNVFADPIELRMRTPSTQFGMFFLRLQPQGTYTIVDQYFPVLNAAQKVEGQQSGADIDRLSFELEQMLVDVKTDAKQRVSAFELLAQMNYKGLQGLAKRLLKDGDIFVRVTAYGIALARGDSSAVNQVAEMLLNPSQELVQNNLIYQLSDTLIGLRKLDAIPTLARLMRAPHPRTRYAAAYALREMEVPATVRPLVVGLYDEDPEVRYLAVSGLARVTTTDWERERQWAPSVAAFAENEQYYLDHWRAKYTP